jgi:multiple sugar transport system permease protein
MNAALIPWLAVPMAFAVAALVWLLLRRIVRGPVALPSSIVGIGIMIGLATAAAAALASTTITDGTAPGGAPTLEAAFSSYAWLTVLGAILGGFAGAWRDVYANLNEANPLVPYLFLLPHALFFLVFIVYPLAFGFYVSVHQWDLLSGNSPFVGLKYYAQLFDPSTPQSEFFWRTLLNTVFFVVVSVPLLVATALGLALLLYRPIFAGPVFRAIFFMPGILSVSVMGILWRWMFDNQSGLINVIREQYFGQPVIQFLTTEGWAWVPIIVGTVWWTIGFNMTLYLAALGGISQSYYEAAQLDGAGPWAQFRFITVPLLAPTTLFIAVTTVLASFQLFGQSLVITAGGPTRSTQSVIQYITEEAFGNNQQSSAGAMAFVFGALMLIFTAFQFRLMAKDLRSSERGN